MLAKVVWNNNFQIDVSNNNLQKSCPQQQFAKKMDHLDHQLDHLDHSDQSNHSDNSDWSKTYQEDNCRIHIV